MNNKLDRQDLRWALTRLPRSLRKIMEESEFKGRIFVGGGYLRSIVAGEPINDVDVFVPSKELAELLAMKLAQAPGDIYKTDNAFTVKGRMTIQIIHRWLFEKPEDVGNSFDFTCCCAVIHYDGAQWDSYCDERFYIDLAAKRLVYRSPKRNEDAGGSMLRVLKYYQKGYRIPLDSLGAVMARMVNAIDYSKFESLDASTPEYEAWVAQLLTAMLIEVDPAIDPLHLAHLPSDKDEVVDV